MEEPLYILQQQRNEDVEMEDDCFWEEVAKAEAIITKREPISAKKEDEDMDQLLDTETPRFESLSVRDDAPSLKRKRVGEDVFTKEAVKQWQGSRIKAWENRYMVILFTLPLHTLFCIDFLKKLIYSEKPITES